jgi:hypothetical protein
LTTESALYPTPQHLVAKYMSDAVASNLTIFGIDISRFATERADKSVLSMTQEYLSETIDLHVIMMQAKKL